MSEESPKRAESTLDHLPELYHRAATPGSMLAALIEASDDLLLGLDARVDRIHQVFSAWDCAERSSGSASGSDACADQVGWLSWLASWVDFERQLNWTALFLREPELGLSEAQVQARRRTIVENAGRLANLRGTRKGLELVLWGCLGVRVEVLERTWTECMRIGLNPVNTRVMNYWDPSRMVEVVWRTRHAPSPALQRGVRSLIDLEAPAHLHVLLRIVVEAPNQDTIELDEIPQ